MFVSDSFNGLVLPLKLTILIAFVDFGFGASLNLYGDFVKMSRSVPLAFFFGLNANGVA